MADPKWNGGRYVAGSGPVAGLAVARMLGHLTYMSDASMQRKFGRRTRASRAFALAEREFEVEHYLERQGRSFVRRFDANSLLYLTKAIDYFDMSEVHGSLDAAVHETRARFLFLTFSSDWLYPPEDMESLASRLRAAGRQVDYHCLPSDGGHDAFLVDHVHQTPIVRRFLELAQ
jgi:homoserine O-acetyltransferase